MMDRHEIYFFLDIDLRSAEYWAQGFKMPRGGNENYTDVMDRARSNNAPDPDKSRPGRPPEEDE